MSIDVAYTEPPATFSRSAAIDLGQARRAILHVKCKAIQNCRDAMDTELGRSDADTVFARRFRRGGASSSFGSWYLWTLVAVMMVWKLLETIVWYRCEQYGGRKCQFPYDLLPEWMWGAHNTRYMLY